MAGAVAFAYYEHCDPLTTKRVIKKGDQILPLFVMDVLNYPGFPGLFVATVFSGALRYWIGYRKSFAMDGAPLQMHK